MFYTRQHFFDKTCLQAKNKVYNTSHNDMPNARKKGKKFVGAWVSNKLYADLQRAARDRDKAASTIIDELLTAHVPGALDFLSESPLSSARADAAAAGAISGAASDASSRGAPTPPKPEGKPIRYRVPRRSKKRKPGGHE